MKWTPYSVYNGVETIDFRHWKRDVNFRELDRWMNYYYEF